MKRWRMMCGLTVFGVLAAACGHERPAQDATASSNPLPDSDKPPHRTANPTTGTPGISTDDPK